MAQQKGRELLIKKITAVGPPIVSTNLCGGITKSLALDNEMIDVTVPSCTTPGGKLEAKFVAGVQTVTFDLDGLADNDAAGKAMLLSAVDQTEVNYQVIVPGFGQFVGFALLANFNFEGPMKGNMGFKTQFQFTGGVTFTPDP